MTAIVLLVLSCIMLVVSHSWVGCTDYTLRTIADENVFDEAKCKGYPRAFKNGHTNSPFGAQTGFNYQAGADGAPCRDKLTSPYLLSYDTARPMATYSPGQNVCLAWSPQNHVAATCANAFIPDSGTQVYVSAANPTADVPVKQMTLVKDFGANPKADAYVGYQHCPMFCSNNVGALCTGCFIVPTTLKPGDVHTFVWNWAFNAPTDIYSTCWEALISTGNTPPTPQPTQPKCTQDSDCRGGICDISGFCVTITVTPTPTTVTPIGVTPTPTVATSGPNVVTPTNPNGGISGQACNYHDQCASRQCGIDGICIPKDNISPAVSVLFALLFVIILAGFVIAVKYPERMPCYQGSANMV